MQLAILPPYIWLLLFITCLGLKLEKLLIMTLTLVRTPTFTRLGSGATTLLTSLLLRSGLLGW